MTTPNTGSIKDLKLVFTYLLRYRKRLAIGITCLIISTTLSMIVPWFTKDAIDSLVAKRPFEEIRNLALQILGLTSVLCLFLFSMRWQIIGVSRRAERDLRNDLYQHLAQLPRQFYDRFSTGDLMSRLTNDLVAVRMVMGPAVLQSTNTLFFVILALIMMLALDPKLTLIAFLPLPIMPLIIYRIGRKVRARSEKVQEGLADINSAVQENLTGIRVITAYNLQNSQIGILERLSKRYLTLNMSLVRVQSLFFPTMLSLSGVSTIVVLFFGGRFVISGRITIGELVAFLSYLSMLTGPMFAIGWVVSMIQRGSASMVRIKQILDVQPDPEPTEPIPPNVEADPVVELTNVWFRYSADQPWILRDVNLSIGRGEVVAIMGLTGAGKSTLIKLLTKSYLATKGTVAIFGVPVERQRTAELRSLLSIAPQEVTLFSDSILENLAFGVHRRAPHDLEAAVQAAQFHTDLDILPNGLETMLGERGINLSGGQKQRLALARALLTNPKLLILDDPFSSVDIATEESILSSFHEITENRARTVLIISHRVNTARRADRIIVIHAGRVMENGTHAELMQAGGLYEDMNNRQQLEEELSRF